ncbi:hypothetical protein LJC68_08685 [Bacteroidales bacterium OttesenSCG-928-B11]|nr:hypothetical protein [Bacteroidales bacterium OttesenSCG-928-E04]MDL2309103.1 hypothetical protein [Bacteroidales bacterium OttesenSCG-928-C03]MDL2312936.1 hypothetical protein [Bacteroidales bacterium OttesenSCG-928-B11]
MKKNILIYALCAAFALNFTSCGEEKTQLEERTDFLTGATKGWQLTAATSSPAYEMAANEFITDILNDGYLYDYEKDDIVIYRESGGIDVDPGSVTDPDGYTKLTNIGQWSFLDDEGKKLSTQIPFFMDAEPEEVNVIELTDKKLRFNYTFNDDESPSKGTYTFTLTYEKK